MGGRLKVNENVLVSGSKSERKSEVKEGRKREERETER